MGRVRILAGCGPAHDLCIVRAPRAGRRGRRPLRRGRGRTRGSDGCAGAAPTVSRLAGDRRKDTSPEGGRQERGADSPGGPYRQPPRGGSAAATSPEGGGKAGCGFAGGPHRQPPRGGSAAATSPEGGGLYYVSIIALPVSNIALPVSNIALPVSIFTLPSSLRQFLLPSGSWH